MNTSKLTKIWEEVNRKGNKDVIELWRKEINVLLDTRPKRKGISFKVYKGDVPKTQKFGRGWLNSDRR